MGLVGGVLWEALGDRLWDVQLDMSLRGSFLDLLLECHCIFKKRALRLASQIIALRLLRNPRHHLWTYGFEHGYEFPDDVMLRDTITAGERGVENHGPKEIVPVLCSIVQQI